VQCGFCTPGLIVAAHDLLARDPDPADADVREALAGNLCRCTGYEKILDAVRLAASRLRTASRPPARAPGPPAEASGPPADASGPPADAPNLPAEPPNPPAGEGP
jgi:carbon-monoxide dehydrogenase small subunit